MALLRSGYFLQIDAMALLRSGYFLQAERVCLIQDSVGGRHNMTTLAALKFGTPDGADQALSLLQGLQKQQLITIQDAAIVSWPANGKKPKTRQTHSMAAAGALGGAFWGMLFGLLFFIPFIGLAIGAVMGGLMGKFSDYGIDDNFIKQVREKVTPGTSALFLLTSGAVVDKVIDELKKLPKFEIIQTNLSKEQEERLRAEFGEDAPEVTQS
jgi:uncharacterized membrane protein